ncbi:MAG: hypothetical protein KJO79_10415 [Verrucomicrobiae bacterium]|nr:hypothetical protein [Verrucomicrobiae bacterium]NNJ87584.1 hypothetical protein [Akkermansiaceae bacterium]
MSRRSRSQTKSKSNLAVYIIIGVAVLAALVIGKVILDKRAQHFSNLSELSITDMKNGATSLSGNKYRVSGKIAEKIKWTADRGQMISLTVDQGEKGSGTIPIKVPTGVDKVNLERGHSYTFMVEIDLEGLPVALDVKAQ